MNFQTSISPSQKSKKPFLPNGRKEAFIKNNSIKKANTNRQLGQESRANHFAQTVAENPKIVSTFLQNSNQFSRKNSKKNAENDGELGSGIPLQKSLIDAFRIHFGEDFSDVQIHADEISTKIAKQFNAGAITINDHIFLNTEVYNPNSVEGLLLLAHELFHTLTPDNQSDTIEVRLKPLTELNDQTPEQKLALERATKIAMGEKGKVNSSILNEDGTRVGWQYLLEYFKTTMGEDTIVADKKDYKQGKFLEENIKYQKRGTATKIKVIDNVHTQVVDKNADLLPSWCGIFVFWAYHKSGIHPPLWEMGKPNFTSKDAYKKGEYLPRPGDLVIKNGYNHHAMVVRTDPETITDTKDLASVKVTTINGNTAGTNHTGGQIQDKTDSYSYWDFYIRPFFAGVKQTPEKDFKLYERLKPSLGQTADNETIKASSGTENIPIKVNKYETNLSPVAQLDFPKSPEKEAVPKPEEPEKSPKEIMANDLEFKSLQRNLDKNAVEAQSHDTPENKTIQAQGSAKSPPTESLGKAKAKKVEKLASLPKPKPFKGEDLKQSILNQVIELLKEKEKDANDSGNVPKVTQHETTDLKQKNIKDIQARKKESVGTVEENHKLPPDESAVEKRTNSDVIVEDPGTEKKISHTEKAVAKPIDNERITLENESAAIDNKMTENEVDEQQLAESEEPAFTGALDQKTESQAEASKIKEDYRAIEDKKLDKDKKIAGTTIGSNIEKIHEFRKGEFGNVDLVKDKTKTADEQKRAEITNHIEKLYSESELSVTTKLAALELTVSEEFDGIINTANKHFKDGVNKQMDDEFTWEWAAKKLDRDDFNRRVSGIFREEKEKYITELSNALTPLTTKIAATLNAIIEEIQAAKDAVIVFVNGLDPALAEIGLQAGKGVLEKFASLESSVNEKQEALTSNLAKKYADGVSSLEKQFKEIMDSRKSWLEKALDAIIDAIKEIINLFLDLKKALERAAEYGKRIIKAPLKFFGNLVRGATDGFNQFVKNIGKHLLQGALEWVTGELGDAGIQLPEKFDFKGILSIILQILGISFNNIKEIAKKVIGEKYVNMLEKGADLGVKGGDKILQIFSILKNEGITGLWEFIKEQFTDLKERLMEEAKGFIINTIVEVAVVKIVSMLIPGAGFISAVKSLIDFLRTLFAKARQIVNIITGIIDTFGEILAGNVSKVANMVEGVLAKFLSLAITFLAAILGLGKIGKKINDIIQKKIKDPINKAITKMMEKLKAVMTKLGVFKFLDKVAEGIKKGTNYVNDKKEKIKEKAKQTWDKFKKWLKIKKTFTTDNGETHTIYFNNSKAAPLMVASDPMTFEAFIKSIETDDDKKKNAAKNKATEIAKKIDAKKKEEFAKKEPTDDEVKQFEETKAKALLDLFILLAEEASILFKTFGAPKTEAKFGDLRTDSEFGTSANILYLNKKYQKNGSGPSSKSPTIFQTINNRKNGAGAFYIKGHLLNEKMGGKGDWDNLTPLSRSGNSQHENNIESVGKKFMDESAVISYDVVPNYDHGTRKAIGDKTIEALKTKADPDFDLKSKIINAENFVPINLACSATLMNKEGDKFVKGPVIFNNKLVDNHIERGPDDYDISGEKKIMVYLDTSVAKLKENLDAAGFSSALIDKILAALKKDKDIKRVDKLFTLGDINDQKDRDKINEQLILFHK